MVPENVRELAKGKNFATFTTLRADGHPATQVMWVDCDDEFVLINTEKHRRKYTNVQRDPRVTVTIWNAENPYQYVEVRGIVEEFVEGPAARAHIDELAWRYVGRPYDPAIIRSERVVLKVRPLQTSKNRP
jgi:PPOX class probable F420-dependent enzyme